MPTSRKERVHSLPTARELLQGLKRADGGATICIVDRREQVLERTAPRQWEGQPKRQTELVAGLEIVGCARPKRRTPRPW